MDTVETVNSPLAGVDRPALLEAMTAVVRLASADVMSVYRRPVAVQLKTDQSPITEIDEAAEALGKSPATVEREWALAKAWLYRRLSAGE